VTVESEVDPVRNKDLLLGRGGPVAAMLTIAQPKNIERDNWPDPVDASSAVAIKRRPVPPEDTRRAESRSTDTC